LVAGGQGLGGYLNSAALYDPLADTWTQTYDMNVSRAWHTATLLPDGTVLVIGGNNGVDVATAELYDPATGKWLALKNMNTARHDHSATLLQDGRVLVAGGRDFNNILKNAELYDPVNNTWTTITSMNDARENHQASLMPNGQVLTSGGSYGLELNSSELFDLGLKYQQPWQPELNSLTSPLSLGEALVCGGIRLRGYGLTEASGSATNNSASNYPLVQLRNSESQQTRWLSPDPSNPFSDTSFTSQPISDFPSGLALVTAFVNGIPSISKFILISTPPPTPTPPPIHPLYLPIVSGG